MSTTPPATVLLTSEPAQRQARLRSRLLPSFPASPMWGWIGPIAVTVLAAILRFNRLGIPSTKIFDEVYYAHDSWNLLHHGYELNADNTGPGFVVHPPLGKWMIAVGEWIFGDNAIGWRFSAAVVGTLSVLILARTARRMTRSTLLGCLAGLLLALDGLEFVQSRTSMLDIFLMFWIVVAFACLVADRDDVRAKVVRKLGADGATTAWPGPRLGVRWWLIGAGAALGAACASKWSGLYFVPVFAVLALAWGTGARRSAGLTRPFTAALRRDALPLIGALFLLGGAVYVASWTGWFVTDGGWDRQWAAGRSSSFSFVPEVIRSWWHYHWQIYHFHVTLSTPHPYQSSPWGWLLLARPVLYYSNYPTHGDLGCSATSCARMIYDLGNPAIWWPSIPALGLMVWRWISRRDWRAAAILACFGAAFLPWLATPDRTMFLFYALPALPFIILALVIALGMALGPTDASFRRRWLGAVGVGAYVLIVVVAFFYFLPILSAMTLPYDAWFHGRAWFSSWV